MEPPSNRFISIVNETGRRLPVGVLRNAASVTLDRHGLGARPLCILVTDDRRIRSLNTSYRDVDETTDVLTFPAGPFAGNSLGDIAISLPFAQAQARRRRVSTTQELGYLAIHGCLHLAGFDDEDEPDRNRMVAEMNRCAQAAGLKPDANWHSIHEVER